MIICLKSYMNIKKLKEHKKATLTYKSYINIKLARERKKAT